jgi:hypothetical protein
MMERILADLARHADDAAEGGLSRGAAGQRAPGSEPQDKP